MGDILKVGSGRVWTIKFRAGPSNEPIYHQQGAATGADWGQGDVTNIEEPSDTSYNQWNVIDSFQASPDRATLTVTLYETTERSAILELIRLRCAFDVQIHQGNCEDPRDFDYGWQKVKVFEDARATGYTPSDMGGLEGESQESVTEEMPISARDIYDILRVGYRQVAASQVGEEVIAVDVCDLVTCGECEGTGSDGCQKVFAVTNAGTGSPGVKPQVIITKDQFGPLAIIERWVTTFAIGENATDGVCVGTYFVVLQSAPTTGGIHYAPAQDMIDQVETWAEVTTGLVTGKGPKKIWNYSPLTSFIAGLGGYMYLMKNPADGVTVLDAGVATAQDLNAIDGWDNENVAAVGQANAFIYTTDGSTFAAGTGPTGPTNNTAVAYRRKKEIWVGGDDGKAYVTTDYGEHWTTKNLPGSPTRVDKIVWASDSVGYIAIRTSAPIAKILRTINGGYTWYVTPESSSQSLPTFDYVNDIAVCEKEVNKLFIGGLADNAADGMLIKGSD
jgi:hypothetical protein